MRDLLHSYFLSSGETLAFAESCTGGLLSFQITRMAGASQYFLGSLVTYAESLKKEVLRVSEETLQGAGAVSERCVLEMAQGLVERTKADWALAVSGMMEPTGAIYYAIMRKGALVESGRLPPLSGEREELMEKTVDLLLQYLWKSIMAS